MSGTNFRLKWFRYFYNSISNWWKRKWWRCISMWAREDLLRNQGRCFPGFQLRWVHSAMDVEYLCRNLLPMRRRVDHRCLHSILLRKMPKWWGLCRWNLQMSRRFLWGPLLKRRRVCWHITLCDDDVINATASYIRRGYSRAVPKLFQTTKSMVFMP